jgi:hypothetical protein
MKTICLCWLFFTTLFLHAEEERPYITGQLLGQTGNMLFQIATTLAHAWDHEAEAFFPDLGSKPEIYQHLFSRCKILPPSHKVSIHVGEQFPLPFQPYMQLGGYFQEERYFAHYRERLIALFAPCKKDLKYIERKYAPLLAHPQSVGVQIRYYRREVVEGYPQYGKQYLEKAMALFPESSLFIVSSDNLEYARNQIPSWAKNVLFLENEPYYIDFFILSFCKDNIITNSSFGWWSAWLNQNPEKKVICPAYWTGYANEHIYPKDWIRIEARPEDL